MTRALKLARGQLGRTAPNPSVGCVIVRDGVVIAEAATGDGGRPHAEEAALDLAAANAAGAIVYVSLEPCSKRSAGHASCAERLITAGVRRVVFGCADPNPAASDGVLVLSDAAIEVEANVLSDEARALNAGFFKRIATGRPLLVIAAGSDSFDAEFVLQGQEKLEEALDRLGATGMTRVFVPSGSPLAAKLTERGLIDETT